MTGNFKVLQNVAAIGQLWNKKINDDSRWMYTDDEGNDYDVIKTCAEHTEMRKLLAIARCPNEGCDGKGWSAHQVAEGTWEQEQCQWCHERKKLLDEHS